MILTTHQKAGLKDCIKILNNNDRLLLKGCAGTGKTFMIKKLLNNIEVIDENTIYCTAPTNKAVKVLKDKVENSNINHITTHSALKLKRSINFEDGSISFKPSFHEHNPPLKKAKILVVDEASMINKELLSYIEKYSKIYNVKVIFVGDEKQLNPVGEDISPVFTNEYPEVELTEIVRQNTGNPIISLSRNLSDIIKKIPNLSNDCGYIYSNDKNRVIKTLSKVNGTNELKYLAWTNREVNNINKLVRENIYGNPNKIELGETLIFNSPYNEIYHTSDEIKINKLLVKEKEFHYIIDKKNKKYEKIKLKYYSINYISEKIENINVIHEDSETLYKNRIKLLRLKAINKIIQWVDYYEFIEQFADFKYNHALSVHKSQASTYKQVIININNINLNHNTKEKNRLLYTGITRASDLIILYNT